MTKAQLIAAIRRYLTAHDVMGDMTDRGVDDRGTRDTPSYRTWITADCELSEAFEALREATK